MLSVDPEICEGGGGHEQAGIKIVMVRTKQACKFGKTILIFVNHRATAQHGDDRIDILQ